MSGSDLEKAAAGACVKFLQKMIAGPSAGHVVNTPFGDGERESLEVAKQCIQAAFHLEETDIANAADLLAAVTFISRATEGMRFSTPLQPTAPPAQPPPQAQPQTQAQAPPAAAAATFSEPLPRGPPPADGSSPSVSDEMKETSLKLKDEGNELMKAEKFKEALAKYDSAIEADPRNAVFYCNRAAAYYYLTMYEHSLADCEHALSLNPSYGRAFGRMGLAYTQLGRHEEARNAYERASNLEPENENYRNNLRFAEEAIRQRRQQQQQQRTPPFGFAGFGGLLQNPALLTAAQQMLENPEMRNLMSNLMRGIVGGGAGADGIAVDLPEDLGQRFSQINPGELNQILEQMFGQAPGRGREDDPSRQPRPQ